MNDPRTCRHKNLRKTVRVTLSMTVGAWNNNLTKRALRSKDVQIDAVLHNHPDNYTYCTDCGLVFGEETIHEAVKRLNMHLNNPAGKINRIKAVRELTGAGLRESKYFVDVVYNGYGNGEPAERFQGMTVARAKQFMEAYIPELYAIAKWSEI